MRLPITQVASEQLEVAINSNDPIVFTRIGLVGLTTYETTNVQKPADGSDIGVSVLIDKNDITGNPTFSELNIYAQVGDGVEFLFAEASIDLDFSGDEDRRVILTVYMDISESDQVTFEYSGGDSAYQVAVAQGFEGTAQEWLDSLRLKVADYTLDTQGDTVVSFTDGTDVTIETGEAERVLAEESRVSAENARASAESNRVSAESSRADAESTRETNETDRVANEEARESAESKRASNESTRQTNEADRESAESGRVTAENERVTSESERNDLYTLIQNKLNQGEFDGKDLEFNWRGTELGVRLEGEEAFEYVELKGDKGDKGDTGEMENLDSSHIVDALGYTPISANDVPEPTWANLQNKPTEFNPTSHTHGINDVTGLRAELDSVPELTKENVGLGNVDNVKQASKAEHDQLATDFNEHQADDAKHGIYTDTGSEPDYSGAKYKLVVINGEPFLEVIEV